MIDRRTILAILVSLSLGACAADGADDDFVSTDVTEATPDDLKADQADLAFTPVHGLSLRASVGRSEEGRVIRSASSFKAAFGIAPPAEIDFSHNWLAVYSGGERPTGGYSAAITRIRLSDSGASVKVTTELTRPGPSCIVTQAFTKPVAIVQFEAQPGAAYSSFTKLTKTDPCAACGAALDAQLAQQVQGMLFMSESDYPLEVVSFPGAGRPGTSKLRTLTGTPASAPVEQRTFGSVMDGLTTVYDPEDPYAVEYAARWQALRTFLEDNLDYLTVIRYGTIQIQVYIIGVSACGDMVGIKTTSIET